MKNPLPISLTKLLRLSPILSPEIPCFKKLHEKFILKIETAEKASFSKTPYSTIKNFCKRSKVYQTGKKVAEDFKDTMQIVFDQFLPQWNYTAKPQ